jgi:hypothetical protein
MWSINWQEKHHHGQNIDTVRYIFLVVFYGSEQGNEPEIYTSSLIINSLHYFVYLCDEREIRSGGLIIIIIIFIDSKTAYKT